MCYPKPTRSWKVHKSTRPRSPYNHFLVPLLFACLFAALRRLRQHAPSFRARPGPKHARVASGMNPSQFVHSLAPKRTDEYHRSGVS